MMTRIRNAGVALAGLIVLGSMAGCSAAVPAPADTSAIDAAAATHTAAEFASAVSPGDANEVYEKTPRGLAAASELVVSGRVASVTAGPSYAPVDMPEDAVSTFYVEIAPEEVVAGSYPIDESLWLLVNWVGPTEQAVWTEFLPSGTPVVAYLHEVNLANGLIDTEKSGWELTPDSSTELPGNGRLWISTSSQGLVFDLGSHTDNLAWPLLETAGSGDLADTLPTGTLIGFPESRLEAD